MVDLSLMEQVAANSINAARRAIDAAQGQGATLCTPGGLSSWLIELGKLEAAWAGVLVQIHALRLKAADVNATELTSKVAGPLPSGPPLDNPALNCGGCNDRSCLECYAQGSDDAQ